MKELSIDWYALREELNMMPHGGKRAFMEQRAAAVGVSYTTLYRGLCKAFEKTKTVERTKKIDPQNLMIKEIARIKLQGEGLTTSAARELSTEDCIDILVAEGWQGARDLVPSTVNRRLVELGFRMRDPKVRFEPVRSNQEHQLDFSRSKYFQMWDYDKSTGRWLLRTTGRELHYKRGEKRLRTWVCQLVDSFSRVRICRAFPSASEDYFLGLEFLYWVWSREMDDHHLRFLPERLKTDNGSFAKRKETREALDALGVELKTSGRNADGKGNKDSQGKVERPFRTLWQKFELKLALQLQRAGKETISLDEYNDRLHQFCTDEQMREHPSPVRAGFRGDLYRKSMLQHSPKQFEDDVFQYAFRTETRYVSDAMEVRFNNEVYEAPSYCIRKTIRVKLNALGDLRGELIHDGEARSFTLKSYRVREQDDFSHREKPTFRQQMQREVEARKKETKAPAPARAKKKSNQLFFPAQPETVKPKSAFAANEEKTAFESVFAAKVYIGKRLPENENYDMYKYVFDDLLDETLEKAIIDEVLTEILRPALRLGGV